MADSLDAIMSATAKPKKTAPTSGVALPSIPASGSGITPPLSAFKKGAAKGLSVLGDVLARPSESVEALLSRGGSAALHALLHGENAAAQQADRDALKTNLHVKQSIDKLPPWGRGLADAGIDTVFDPTTYLGGLGLIEKAVKTTAPHLAALAAKSASRAALPRAAYDTLTANGEAVRGIYAALPAAKAQKVIGHLEMAKRRMQNAQRMNPSAVPATSYARRAANDKAAQLILQTNFGLPKNLALKPAEKAAIAGAVRRYIVGPPKLPRSELSKALVGGDSTIQRLVEATNLPYFMLPFRHMANIGALTGLRDPGGLAETLARKIGQNISPSLKAANEKMIEDFQHRGMQGFSDYRGMPSGLQGLAGLAGKIKPLAPIARGVQGAANKAYDWSQKTLWNWDDLARATLMKRALKHGLSPEDAAHQTNRALVDYGVRPPFTESLYDVAPFATFRTGIPGAVLRSVAQHPERAQIADRLSGGTFTGGTGSGGVERMYLPPADVGRGVLGDPPGYLRGTLSWPVQDMISLGGDIAAATLHGEPKTAKTTQQLAHYFTYGKPVVYYDKKQKKWKSMLPSQLIRVPFSDEMFQNLSPFKKQGLAQDLLQSQFGIKPP